MQLVLPRWRRTGDSESDAWAGSLRRVTADLDELNQSTEKYFLNIGGKLAGFMNAVNLISSELAGLANLMSGEQGRGASEALTAALQRSREMGLHAQEGKRDLAGMRQQADRLRKGLAEFQKTTSNFHILAILTRIETARLGGAGSGFGDLADDMKSLAGNVQAGVERALETAASLILPIENALREMEAIEEGQARDLPAVISGVQENLSLFREIQDRAHDSVLRLRTQSEAISGAFMKVIVSIQFHDITRQQLEHVADILRRLSEASGKRRSPAAVLTLQSSQLQDAAAKFAVSVGSVASSLNDVAARVREMVEESRTLCGSSGNEPSLSPMARGCGAILDNLMVCAEAEAAAQAISGSLSEPIGRMRDSMEGIQAVEVRMQRIGLNANIRAAHLGAPADALSVLSGKLQHLAVECGQRSAGLVEGLGSMSSSALRLSRQGESSQPGRACMEGLRAAIADLHSSTGCASAQTARILDCGGRLREDLAATRESFTIGVLFAEAVSRARDAIREIGEMCEPGCAGGDAAVLAGFAANYTMHSEREVYENAAGVPADSAGQTGDDVEFF